MVRERIMIEYYKDENDVLHEKSGMDFRIKTGLHSGDGLTLISKNQIPDTASSMDGKETIVSSNNE